MLALVRLRILTARSCARTWRLGIFVMTVIGVLLPGIDPVTTLLSVIPLVLLYVLSIGLATFLEPRWRRARGRRADVSYPKIELHVHLEGTVRPTTLLEIAARNDYPLPADTEEGLAELYDFRDFAHFIEVWILTTNALRTAEDFRQVVVDYAAEAASHGAVYLEGIFSPGERVRRGVGWDEIFSGYCDGAQEARELHGVEVRLTPDIVRGFPLDEAEQVVRHSAAYRDRGIVGVGLGGLEADFPPEPYEPAFTLAREEGLASVPHAGEVAGPAFGARRARGARRRPPPPRHPRRRGPGPRERARRPADRARRLPDLEPAHAGRVLAGGAPAAAARCGRRSSARSPPTTRRCSAPTSRRTTRRRPRSASTRATSSRPGSRARSATTRRRRACAPSGDAFDWNALQVP